MLALHSRFVGRIPATQGVGSGDEMPTPLAFVAYTDLGVARSILEFVRLAAFASAAAREDNILVVPVTLNFREFAQGGLFHHFAVPCAWSRRKAPYMTFHPGLDVLNQSQ